MWVLEPYQKDGLVTVQRGDSGSWVMDPNKGSVFGIVIASTSYTVYLMPLKDVIQSAIDKGHQGKWVLPSSEEVIEKKLELELELEAATKAALEVMEARKKLRSINTIIVPTISKEPS